MRPLILLVFGCLAAACAAQTAQTARPPASAGVREPGLRAELLRRAAVDQAVRESVTAVLRSGAAPDSALLARMVAVDSGNTAWVSGVLARWGWPGRSLVGSDGTNAAFLLVQHADRDTVVQVRGLSLLERAYRAGEASGQQLALLTDRVAAARGKPQVYGTQADIRDGRVRLKPIADSAGVDARRAAVGLPPLREYVRVLDSVYTAHPPP